MSKKLPEVFHNNIDKKINNNDDVFYSLKSNKDLNKDKDEKKNIDIKNIRKKINEIFASSNYVYKANVIIKTNDEIINKKIIGRNSKYLITMDNKTIPIDDIIDIEVKK